MVALMVSKLVVSKAYQMAEKLAASLVEMLADAKVEKKVYLWVVSKV